MIGDFRRAAGPGVDNVAGQAALEWRSGHVPGDDPGLDS